MGTLANSEDPDEMQHNAAFHQGLHCLLKLKPPSVTEIHHNLVTFSCDSLRYTKGNPIFILSICMGKSLAFESQTSINKLTAPSAYQQSSKKQFYK